MDLKTINQAIFDTLKQVAPDDFRFIVVMWSGLDHRAAISSNEMNPETVGKMLAGASNIVARSKPVDFLCDEVAGNA